MALPRTSWPRRPLLVLIILILLLVIGYAARAWDGGSQPAGSHVVSAPLASGPFTSGPLTSGGLSRVAQPAQDGGRLAAKAAIPS